LCTKFIPERINVISETLLNEEQNISRRRSMFTIQHLLERHGEYNPGMRLLFIENIKTFE
jgi:hypothetical protein